MTDELKNIKDLDLEVETLTDEDLEAPTGGSAGTQTCAATVRCPATTLCPPQEE